MARSVIVLGGGTAGWMTASYLDAAFGDRVSVTVVESSDVPTVGVGEASFTTIRHFFEFLGLTEDEWMPPCNATYKLAIRFRDWQDKQHDFYHPFEHAGVVDGFTLADWWLSAGRDGRFDRDIYLVSALCDANRSPRYLDGSMFEADSGGGVAANSPTLGEETAQFPYAYHFDASLLAAFLAERATRRGVRRIIDHVVDVGRDERGWITHLNGKNNPLLAADLYIDCTGFRGLLLGDALQEPFVSFAGSLPNDRAVALRVPIDMEAIGVHPYTTATAVDAGWIWTIPLYGRIGTGYVYSSDYCTADEAEKALREYVGPKAADLPANHIRMRIGRSRNSWVNNCIAIGLSSGFVEPLESTGIFLIHYGIEQLVRYWPDEQWDDELRASYNRRVARCQDGVRDFLFLHYYAAARTDSAYWRDAKKRPLPEGIGDLVAQWRTALPDNESVYPHYHGFEPSSYACMLLGLGGIAVKPRPALQLLGGLAARRAVDSTRARGRDLVQKLPSHFEYLLKQHERTA